MENSNEFSIKKNVWPSSGPHNWECSIIKRKMTWMNCNQPDRGNYCFHSQDWVYVDKLNSLITLWNAEVENERKQERFFCGLLICHQIHTPIIIIISNTIKQLLTHTICAIATGPVVLVRNIKKLLSPKDSPQESIRTSLIAFSQIFDSLTVSVNMQLHWMMTNIVLLAFVFNIGITKSFLVVTILVQFFFP